VSDACRATCAHLSQHLEGELSPAADARVRAHLAGCAACRRELELLRLTVGALRALPELPAPAGILAGVRARLRPEPWYRRLLSGRQWLVGVPIGALATLLVVVGVTFFQARYPGIGTVVAPELADKRQAAPATTPAAQAPEPGAGPATLPAPAAAPPAAPAVIPAPMPPRPAAPAPRVPAAAKVAQLAEAPVVSKAKDADAATERLIAADETPALRNAPSPAPPPAPAETYPAPAPAAERAASFPERAPETAGVEPKQERAPARWASRESAPKGDLAANRAEPSAAATTAAEAPQRHRGAAIGALEESPRTVTSLRSLPESGGGYGADHAGGSGSTRTSPAPQPSTTVARRQAAEFKKVGAAEGTTADASGVVSLGAPASSAPRSAATTATPQLEARRPETEAVPLRVVCLLAPGGDDLNDVKRLLRREGAGEVTARTLDPQEVREAFAPHRSRLSPRLEPTRGWFLRAEIAPRLAGRLLDAIANHPGLRVLEYGELPPEQARQTAPVRVRLTVLR
jgi:hypothetical protein